MSADVSEVSDSVGGGCRVSADVSEVSDSVGGGCRESVGVLLEGSTKDPEPPPPPHAASMKANTAAKATQTGLMSCTESSFGETTDQ